MTFEIILLAALTLVAASVGTLTGFGTSTIMVPVLLFFFPLPLTLLFAGVIHWFGDIWKMMFFRSGLNLKLLLLFGATGIIASYIGASLIITIPEKMLSRLLGAFFLIYVGWLWFKPQWRLPERNTTALVGGVLSGFFAGVFGVGGAVRGAFLSAYNLPKSVYLFTSGAIAFFIDSTRLATYWSQGIRLNGSLLIALVVSIPASLAGAYVAKRIVGIIPQDRFRVVVAVFLAAVAIKFLIWP
jgi:uncharacterized membrane protein YfcA